jgi:hypothetical protein
MKLISHQGRKTRKGLNMFLIDSNRCAFYAKSLRRKEGNKLSFEPLRLRG